MPTPVEISFQQLIEALADTDTPLNPRYLYRLSDLETDEYELLKPVWLSLPVWRRRALMQDVEQLGARDTLLDFVSLSKIALKDEDAQVRLSAVHTLWEYESMGLIQVFTDLSEKEPDIKVRAAAVQGLGRFVYAGEIDEIPPARLEEIENHLLITFKNGKDDPTVRRAALESLGYSSREEIPDLIRSAFASDDISWQASALLAMGRSANPQWRSEVLAMLKSKYPRLRTEAARAAGELELPETVPFLLEMLDEPHDDLRSVCIWSLSQIGGEGVRETLEKLYEQAEDEEELDLIESALENLAFTEGARIMPLFDFPDSEDAEGDEDNWYKEFETIEDLFDDEEDDLD